MFGVMTAPRAPGASDSRSERELTQALELLESRPSGPVTVGALRELGVQTPAQVIYTLQLAGHAIDRVACTDREGQRVLGYQLRGSGTSVSDPEALPLTIHQPGGFQCPQD